MSAKGQGGAKHFCVYGGPEGGSVARVSGGQTTYSAQDRRTRVRRFFYVLVDTPDGGRAFVPEDDDCLRLALLSQTGEAGDRESETLVAEIKRRGLVAKAQG